MVEPSDRQVAALGRRDDWRAAGGGPWIAATYYRDQRGGGAFTDDGWFRTGDVATIDAEGYIRIVDRTKDLREVRRRVDLLGGAGERAHGPPEGAGGRGDRRPARALGGAPSGLRGREPGETVTEEELLAHLAPHLAKWRLPDHVAFIDEVPKTSVGKFYKRTLRDKFAGYRLPE